MKVPIARPSFDACEQAAIVKPLESGWVVQGPFVARFEELFARFAGAPHAIAVTNCTAALQLSLEALGVGPGDRVLMPAFTYVATANAALAAGAECVFCDVELASFNVDPAALEAALDAGPVAALVPVHLFGLCADMERVMAIADGRGLRVVEDAACGFDAWIGGRHAGTWGDAGCFSFHPRKAISTGEGGMIVTQDGPLAARLRSLRDHGAAQSDLARHEAADGFLLPEFPLRGHNVRMTDFQGAVGVCQLEKAPRLMARRRELAARYAEALADLPWLALPGAPAGFRHAWQAYVCLFTGGEDVAGLEPERIERLSAQRGRLMAALAARGIATRQGTHCVPELAYYRARYGLEPALFPRAHAADRLSLALPLFPAMTDEQFDHVVRALHEAAPEGGPR